MPWGLVGMLVLVWLGERALTRSEMSFLPPDYWDWRQTGKMARTEAGGAEVLCFGDSLVKSGVLTPVLEARLGRRAYNLAVPMGSGPTSYFLFRRALRSGARPSAVLIDAVPFVLNISPNEPRSLRRWPELLRPDELLDLAWATRAPTLFARVALAGLIPSLRDRDEIRAAVPVLFRGEPLRHAFLAAQYLRNMRVNRGATAMETGPRGSPDLGPASEWIFQRFAPDPVNVAYLDRLLDLAARRKVPVFLVVPPPSTRAQVYAEGNGFDSAHTRFLQSLQARHPGLTVLDGRRSGYGPSLHFMDPLHLNHVGASAFTDDVSATLARALEGRPVPRWVNLPPYRARPETMEVEDLGESALAITNPANVRR
jgi:hypothetical protein